MMDRFEVDGGRPLDGRIVCSGAKNASLPLMAAAMLADGVTVLENVPDLQDIRTMAMVLRYLGTDVRLEDGILTIDTTKCHGWDAPYELVRKMRASFYVLGPLLARYGRGNVSLPGGCALGSRPVDLHLKAFERLGVDIVVEGGYIIAKTGKLKGNHVHFDISSVGATGNLMMAAVAAEGVTVIDNAACEPEIVDLAEMLVKMGAEIKGYGTPHVEITGPTELKPVRWNVIPDRIEAGSFLMAGAITRGRVTVNNCFPDHLSAVLDKLLETGVNLEIGDDVITLDARDVRLQANDITTAAYPGFPTDLQPLWIPLMMSAHGDSVVTDTIYPERFTHILELARLGGQIRKKSNSAYIRGNDHLTGASVMCSDIRAAAGLVLATIAAKGRSDILRIYHIDRGYERIEDKLTQLGGVVRRKRE